MTILSTIVYSTFAHTVHFTYTLNVLELHGIGDDARTNSHGAHLKFPMASAENGRRPTGGAGYRTGPGLIDNPRVEAHR